MEAWGCGAADLKLCCSSRLDLSNVIQDKRILSPLLLVIANPELHRHWIGKFPAA